MLGATRLIQNFLNINMLNENNVIYLFIPFTITFIE